MQVKDVRRRLVQSTLFTRAECSIKGGENCDGNKGEELAEEEQGECGGSKKRSGSKRKLNSKSKATPPASPKKVIENGEETSINQVDDNGSPIITKSHSFFVKASERRQQKRQQEQPVLIESSEDNEKMCSPPRTRANGRGTPRKPKRQDNSTPRKERRNSTPNKKMKSAKRELCCNQIPFDLAADEQQLPAIPDLRLEAKLSAEENSRVFGGKQIHPFFTSWKGGKSSQDLTDSESKWPSQRKEKGIAFNLIHVFEDVECDLTTLNWGDWVFLGRSAIDDQDCGWSPVYEGSVDSLNFDNFLNVSHIPKTSLYQYSDLCSVPQKEVNGLPNNPEGSHLLSPLLIPNNRGMCIGLQKDLDMQPKDAEDILTSSDEPMLEDHILEKGDFCDGSLESELQDRLLEERIMSHYHTSQNQTKNCLWTDKYQPQNAKQICGNGEPVKFLSEWLHLWHKRGSITSRGCIDGDYSSVQDMDHDYQQSDSDTDSGEESLKNVLLVTGPVGSGKSAAIYACARDQGFQIIEINASDWRNGALVKQKFGEAVESHWLQRTVENATKTDNKPVSKFFKAANEETHFSDDEVIEVTPVSDKKDSQDADSWPKMSASGSDQSANHQTEIKTLILFEDVDATVDEDHGFITTIQQLAETAKRPMILTSNSDNPVLPKNLDRLELSFSFPSAEELLGLVSMICGAEKANIHPCLVERFVTYCKGDIRKTIMLLQFWCQGQTPVRDNELHATYWPVLFDLDAGHHILPRIIQWGHPSQLSEFVADEILKSLTLTEETHGLMDTNIVEDLKNIHVHVSERDLVELKKEAMLSQCSLDEVECSQFDAYSELFDFSNSPIASARQNRRRKVNTVLSSDSEDESLNIPLVLTGEDINTNLLDTKNTPERIFNSVVEKLESDCQLLKRCDCSQMEDTCKSSDVSCVPESSIVAETEIFNETELYSTTLSYGHFINETGDICIFQDQDSIPTLEPAIGSQSHIMFSDQEMLRNNFDLNTAFDDQEEIGDSLSKSEADVLGGYQLLDECSRVDFMRRLKPPLENSESDHVIDFVKETWKKLHDQCGDLLNKYVTLEEKTACRGLVFAHGMSNLISEADLLLQGCQIIAFDWLGSSMVPSEKAHSYTYYDSQLEMSSILAQHGMCFYAKEIASLGSVVGSMNLVDLASEMLSSSENSVALGKLASRDQRKGAAFHEYISTLTQISRYEASRLSECTRRNQRRARVPRHYLTSGSLGMSTEEISSLAIDDGDAEGFRTTPMVYMSRRRGRGPSNRGQRNIYSDEA
ncbi:ATPase family aaa domain-containing protein 5 [Phtheirospermum japonicum]|uniref:ATPase family aaa domain-containing protein 5 n=1 Tax=Phtheirospermum japonicum TaxID=374723 RepID=A0A830C073_9LAMI|nr:ATPase family aaa domain-containing protein 5 [Phtheirospermum japonicum]